MNAQIDIDLNVSIQESDGIKVADYYSKGYQNLIEICKRFALTDVLNPSLQYEISYGKLESRNWS